MGIFGNLFGGKTQAKIEEALQKGAKIVDVRTPAEYSGGHVKGSVNIPLNTINGHIDKLRKEGKPIVLCCASGMRSGQATSVLQQHGIEAYNAGSWFNLK